MVGHNHWYPHEVVLRAAQSTQRLLAVEQCLGREAPEGADHFRPDELYLSTKIRPTRRNFICPGVPVLRRAAFEDVADEDLVAAEPNSRQHLVQQLARRADEGTARAILFVARRFADDQQVCVAIALTEDDCRSAFGQPATRAAQHLGSQRLEFVA